MVDHVMEVVYKTHPMFESNPPPEPPPAPDQTKARRVQARIGAHGSPEVKALLYEKWIPERIRFFNQARLLTMVRDAQDHGRDPKAELGVHTTDQYKVVQEHRDQLQTITRELEDRVNEELRS